LTKKGRCYTVRTGEGSVKIPKVMLAGFEIVFGVVLSLPSNQNKGFDCTAEALLLYLI
jgi:hypothetical protein